MYEIISDTPERFEAQGHVFCDAIATKTVRVDGDLVCSLIVADSVEVVNGSLLCPKIVVVSLHADILGAFGEAVVNVPGWTFKWVRPLVVLPHEAEGTPAGSIANGIAVIRALGLPELHRHAASLAEATTCRAFWREFRTFQDAAQVLYDTGHGTPLQRQFMECLQRHGLPLGVWRF